MRNKNFKPEAAIQIQTEQLNNWKKVLLPEVYKALVEYATQDNAKAKSGYDICRGSSLSCFVENYALGYYDPASQIL